MNTPNENQPERALSTNLAQPSRELAADWLTPTNLQSAMELARLMAEAKLVPPHLQKSVSDCLLVISQAARWRMDPFAVAQATAVVRGKLAFEGKLVAAALIATGAIDGGLDYEYDGEGDRMTVVVTATRRRDGKVCKLRGSVAQWKTENDNWRKDPESMLAYRGTRQWARRYTPETILGVVTPDEVEDVRDAQDVTVRSADAVPEAKAPKRRVVKEAAESEKPADAAPAASETPPFEKPAPDPRVALLIAEATALHSSGAAGAAEVRAITNQLGVTKLQNTPIARLDEALAKVRAGAQALGVAAQQQAGGGNAG